MTLECMAQRRELDTSRGCEGAASQPQHASEDDEYGLPSSIKLGLGDFIFYR